MKTFGIRLLTVALLLTAMAASALARPESRDWVEIARKRYTKLLSHRDVVMSVEEQKTFATNFYDLRIWNSMWYLGVKIIKNPMDLWMMQQVIYEVKPDFIIETGTHRGGSALYWAHILDGLELKDSRVITLDVDATRHPEAAKTALWKHYVTFIHSSSTDKETVSKIARMVKGKKVLVTLDALHDMDFVLEELRLYAPLVSPGSYIVVEDTFLDGAARVEHPGPLAAVRAYLDEGGSKLFEPDLLREAFVLTKNPGGWLRRKAK